MEVAEVAASCNQIRRSVRQRSALQRREQRNPACASPVRRRCRGPEPA
jgi:hypothetical protein